MNRSHLWKFLLVLFVVVIIMLILILILCLRLHARDDSGRRAVVVPHAGKSARAGTCVGCKRRDRNGRNP